MLHVMLHWQLWSKTCQGDARGDGILCKIKYFSVSHKPLRWTAHNYLFKGTFHIIHVFESCGTVYLSRLLQCDFWRCWLERVPLSLQLNRSMVTMTTGMLLRQPLNGFKHWWRLRWWSHMNQHKELPGVVQHWSVAETTSPVIHVSAQLFFCLLWSKGRQLKQEMNTCHAWFRNFVRFISLERYT